MLDSAGKRVAEQGQLQFLAERRERLDIPDGCRQIIPRARRSRRKLRVDRRVSGKTSVDVAADRRRRREATSAVDEASERGTEAQCHVGNDASEHTAETGFSPVLLASVVHGEVKLCVLTSSLRRQVERQRSTRTEDAAAVHQIHQSTLNNSSRHW